MKLNSHTALKCVINSIFGDWNGIQILLFPTTLIYLMNSFSFLYWMSGILTQDQHFLPISLFSLIFFFVCFMIIKFYSFRSETETIKDHHNDMTRFLLEFHKGLFMVVIVSAVLYLLYTFLGYFYSIQLPIKKIYAHFMQYISIALIMFYYIQSVWTRPFRSKGMSYPRAIRHVMVYARHNIQSTLVFTVLQILIVLCSAKLFQVLVIFLISPGIDLVSALIGFSLRPELLPVGGMGELFFNLWVIFSVFIVSNLIFAPIIALFNILIKMIHPLKA